MIFLPVNMAFGQGTVSSGNSDLKEGMFGITYVCVGTINGQTSEVPCSTFTQLIAAVKGIVGFATTLALSFSVVVIVYAGWKYMTSGGSPEKRSEANKMFQKVLWGIFWILGAWLVINLIMNTLTSGTGVQQILK